MFIKPRRGPHRTAVMVSATLLASVAWAVEEAAPAVDWAAQAQLWVREASTGQLRRARVGASAGKPTPVAGSDLTVAAAITRRGGHWEGAGEVMAPTGSPDRAVDVVVRLPFQPALWWSRISEALAPNRANRAATPSADLALPAGAAVLEAITDGGLTQDVFPVGCVTSPGGGGGVALAIPPDFPCRFRLAYLQSEGCLELTFRFGLSGAAPTEFRHRAPFRFVIMSVDGRWGMRDAVRQYYKMFPQAFVRRTRASGLWLFAINSLEQVPDPENYAFWEGPLPWKGRADPDSPGHAFWRDASLQRPVASAPPAIGKFPYIIVGQREFTHLARQPRSYNDVLAVMQTEPARDNPPAGEKDYWGGSWRDVRAIIESSGLRDAEGRWVHRLRNTRWGAESITFPVNPSPFLPGRTVAASTLAAVEAKLRQFPGLAGIYVDSLASWGSYDNFRRDHYAAARAPLTYGEDGRVCLPNWIPHIDFLRELRRRIGDRLVFGNGIRQGRAFCAFECDILGVETNANDLKHRRNLDFYRTVGGAKPFLFLYHSEHDIPRAETEEYIQRFIAMGLSPEVKSEPWGRNKQRDADLFARFLPIYRRLDLAGWQPVTHAATDHPAVWIERFGSTPAECHFTLYNPDPKPVRIRLTIAWDELGWGQPSEMAELVTGTPVAAPLYDITLPGRSLRVLPVGGGSPAVIK